MLAVPPRLSSIGLAALPTSPPVLRSSTGPVEFVKPVPALLCCRVDASRDTRPWAVKLAIVRLPGLASRTPPPDCTARAPLMLKPTGVCSCRLTPTTVVRSVTRVPGARLAGRLEVVMVALPLPAAMACQRLASPKSVSSRSRLAAAPI